MGLFALLGLTGQADDEEPLDRVQREERMTAAERAEFERWLEEHQVDPRAHRAE
jgi:hypothetical protein